MYVLGKARDWVCGLKHCVHEIKFGYLWRQWSVWYGLVTSIHTYIICVYIALFQKMIKALLYQNSYWVKKCVFSIDLNLFKLSTWRSVRGSLFHNAGTKLAKALSPYEVYVLLHKKRFWLACDLRNLVLLVWV